jgi:hypothetical protein
MGGKRGAAAATSQGPAAKRAACLAPRAEQAAAGAPAAEAKPGKAAKAKKEPGSAAAPTPSPAALAWRDRLVAAHRVFQEKRQDFLHYRLCVSPRFVVHRAAPRGGRAGPPATVTHPSPYPCDSPQVGLRAHRP